MLLKNDNSNKNKYSFDFYYNFLYSGRSQGFLFFPWAVTRMWALEDQSFIFLTSDVLLILLPCFSSWYFLNFTFKIFYCILHVYVLIYNFSELFSIGIFFFLREYSLFFTMEITLLLLPSLLLFPLHFLCVCVCVFSFCFCLGLHLPCWEVFSSVLGSSALNLFSRANHENAPLMTCVKGDGRQQCRLRSLRIIFCRETQT